MIEGFSISKVSNGWILRVEYTMSTCKIYYKTWKDLLKDLVEYELK